MRVTSLRVKLEETKPKAGVVDTIIKNVSETLNSNPEIILNTGNQGLDLNLLIQNLTNLSKLVVDIKHNLYDNYSKEFINQVQLGSFINTVVNVFGIQKVDILKTILQNDNSDKINNILYGLMKKSLKLISAEYVANNRVSIFGLLEVFRKKILIFNEKKISESLILFTEDISSELVEKYFSSKAQPNININVHNAIAIQESVGYDEYPKDFVDLIFLEIGKIVKIRKDIKQDEFALSINRLTNLRQKFLDSAQIYIDNIISKQVEILFSGFAKVEVNIEKMVTEFSKFAILNGNPNFLELISQAETKDELYELLLEFQKQSGYFLLKLQNDVLQLTLIGDTLINELLKISERQPIQLQKNTEIGDKNKIDKMNFGTNLLADFSMKSEKNTKFVIGNITTTSSTVNLFNKGNTAVRRNWKLFADIVSKSNNIKHFILMMQSQENKKFDFKYLESDKCHQIRLSLSCRAQILLDEARNTITLDYFGKHK